MKPKNFPGRKNTRRIKAQKRSGINNFNIINQNFALSIRTKKDRSKQGK